MMAAGLLARNARERGLKAKPWVKTSLAPGSRVVTDYFTKAGLLDDLAAVGFNLVGYGCTTCIGNSGPLKPEISAGVKAGDLIACAVLSGNRNFEGRVHPEVSMNFLASPPLVVAYALAGSLDVDLTTRAARHRQERQARVPRGHLAERPRSAGSVARSINSAMFRQSYASVFDGDENWQAIKVPAGKIYAWDAKSTYVKNPPYFDGMTMTPGALSDISGARVLALLGDSVTTDHISPAGNIAKTSPAAKYLVEQGVQPVDFNQYGARRGNHEVMMRGTFANIRLRNLLVPGTEGGVTMHLPSGEQMSIYDAAMRYKQEGTPLVILAGKEYGTGSSRDWAAKGTMLLGVKAVIAESFERIHRSNLIGMGVLPLQFLPGQNAQSLGLTGREVFDISGLTTGDAKNVHGHGDAAGRQGHQLRGARAHRHAEGARLLPPRRHPAVRAAAAGGFGARRLMQSGACPSNSDLLRPSLLAVFDLDGTITRHDTLIPYVLGYLQRRPWRLFGFLLALPAVLLYALGRSDRGALKGAVMHWTLGGSSRHDLDQWTARFVPRLLENGVFRQAMDQIAEHKRNGDVLVLMTASPDLYVPAIARHLGFTEAICTGVRWHGDRLDGRLTTENCRGQEKVRRFGELRAATGAFERRLRQRRQRPRPSAAGRQRRAGQWQRTCAPARGRSGCRLRKLAIARHFELLTGPGHAGKVI